MTKKIVFYAETDDEWLMFYTNKNEILGIALSKSEYPTIEDFKRMLSSCEDAPIEPEELLGVKIIEVQEVE